MTDCVAPLDEARIGRTWDGSFRTKDALGLRGIASPSPRDRLGSGLASRMGAQYGGRAALCALRLRRGGLVWLPDV